MDWEKMNFRTEKEGKGKLSSSRCLTRAGAGVCHGTRGLTIRAVASYVKQLSFVPA